MAIEAERLLATFEARFTSLEKALAKARTDSKATFTVIEGEGRKAENALANIGTRGVPGIAKLNQSLSVTRLNTANVAAQFNDIGVQLASGTSPFLVALQQGTQLNQVLGGLGARGVVGALGGAFTSLLNPISLATIAIIGLGGTAIQYFTELLSSGEKSAEQLQKEAQLIQQVAAEWGDAVPALKEYAAEREKLANQEQLAQATDRAVQDKFAAVKTTVDELSTSVGDLVVRLGDTGKNLPQLSELQDAFHDLSDAVDDGTATAEDAKRVQLALVGLFLDTSIPAVDALATQFYALRDAIAAASGAAAGFKADAGLQQSVLPVLGSVPPVFSGEGKFLDEAGVQDFRARNTKSQFQIDAGRGARGGSKGKSEEERERESIAKLIESLEFEQEMLGKTNEERRIANALRDAGAYATEEQRARIEELIPAIEREREALKKSEEAMKLINDLGRDVLGGMIADLRAGKTGAEALAGALDRVADRLLDIGIDLLLDGLTGGGGGGIGKLFAGIFHQGGKVGGSTTRRAVPAAAFIGAPRFHSGGEVPALLRRGEIVDPGDGSQFRKHFGGAASSISMPITINAPGADAAQLRQVREEVVKLRKEVPNMVAKTNHTTQTRGTRPAS